MKKVVVLALLLFVCVGSLLAQENDKQKKKSITDSLFRIDQVDVMQKKKIVFQKVCKFQFIYFCNRTVKNNLLWNLHMSK